MSSSIQNLAPIMPFIEPTEPIELPSVFDLENSNASQPTQPSTNLPSALPQQQADQNSLTYKGKTTNPHTSNPDDPIENISEKHNRTPSQEAIIEKTRMELEQKIGELNQLKTQLAQTEKRERELASKITT